MFFAESAIIQDIVSFFICGNTDMKMKHDPPFAKRLKEARLRAGLSQRGLGLKVGLRPNQASPRINRYELGVHVPPDFGLIQKIADVLGVLPEYFFCPDDTRADLILEIGKMKMDQRTDLLQKLKAGDAG